MDLSRATIGVLFLDHRHLSDIFLVTVCRNLCGTQFALFSAYSLKETHHLATNA